MARLPSEQATADAVAEDLADRITARLTASGRHPLYEDGDTHEVQGFRASGAGSLGDLVASSTQLAEWSARYPSGGPSQEGRVASQPIDAPGLVRHLLRARTLITSADTSAGDLVLDVQRGLIEPGLVRPLTLRSLVTIIPVSTDTISWVKETSRVEAAASVAEATALTGTSGTKPEGGLVFDVVTDVIKQVALWTPCSKRILSDAPQLQAYVNEYITHDLGRELEDQMLAGDGTGENLLGLLNNPGVLTQGVPADGNNFDAIRLAKAQVVVSGRTIPNAVVLNPNDSAGMDISKSGSAAAPFGYWGAGPFGAGNGPPTLWGMRVVESDAIVEGTALVGDFARSVLYDRQQATLAVGTAGDDFIRNILRVLGELRVGFAVLRPSAFVIVTLS